MHSTPEPLQDSFRAALVGMAVGDALGFALKGLPPQGVGACLALTQDFPDKPRGRFAKGQFSDDTQLMLAAAESVVREGKVDARSFAAHVAWLWEEGIILLPPPTLAASAERLMRGVPWMSAGAPTGEVEPSVLSRALIVGLWTRDSATRRSREAQALAVVTHKAPVCAAACAAYAEAVALATGRALPTVESLCAALAAAAHPHDAQLAEELFHLSPVFGWEPNRALRALRCIGVSPAKVEATPGMPAHVTPVLLTALYVSFRFPQDLREALGWALSVGGEVDVVAALVGGLWGARAGMEALPVRLRRQVLYGEHLVQVADRLYDAQARQQSARAQVPAHRLRG
jgi:ADP-ribosyl-[dinitrogen reductase] hydrolase